jgi:hypothetical protein
MKLCRECRWVTWPWRNIRDSWGAVCTHPSVPPRNAEPDFVTGHKHTQLPGTFCEQERRGPRGCGPDGMHWEPKSGSGGGFV